MAAALTGATALSPLDAHKGDVYAIGVMGLLWLSGKGNMPFGPTKAQATRMQTAKGGETSKALEAAALHVGRMQQDWVSTAQLA